MDKYIIVDIDGTLSKVGDRLKYINCENQDWDSFYDHCDEDEPIEQICNLVKSLFLYFHYKIIFCTGRPEKVREKTRDWIRKYVFSAMGRNLLMRVDGDFRHDIEVKPELLLNAGISFSDIAFVIEDRNSMVQKWRELGLVCLQCAEGNF